MKKKIRFLTALVLLCILVSACSTNKHDSSNAGQNGNNKAATTIAATETKEPQPSTAEKEALEVEKYSAYIDLSNLMNGRLQDVLNDYFEEFGQESAPVIDKNFSATLLSISTYDEKTLQTAFDAAANEPKFEKLDKAMNQLKPALKELTAALADAHEYYEIKGYVDDKFAESKVLHTRILKAYKAYNKATQTFFPVIEAMADERNRKNLQQYKDNDELIKYSILTFTLDAQALAMEMDNQGITADNIVQLDMNKFKPKYKILTDDLKRLSQYADDETRVKAEGFRSGFLDSFVDAAKETKVSASNIIERVNSKRKVDNFDLRSSFFRENQEGTPENFSSQLRKMITEYNRMRN